MFSSVHTTDAASTVARIADAFPPERQPTVRQDLAMALAAVYTQTLLPKRNGGRVPAGELLMMSYGARQHYADLPVMPRSLLTSWPAAGIAPQGSA